LWQVVFGELRDIYPPQQEAGMPTLSIEYATQAEHLALEQAIAFLAQMRRVAASAPDGSVLAAGAGGLHGEAPDEAEVRGAAGQGAEHRQRAGGGEHQAWATRG
jgi:hypothetical protein